MTTYTDVPKVSILVPVFNRKHLIGECIQSALDQTYKDFEVVVVDNASDDGTWEICQRFAILDPRLRVFRNDTNIGPVCNWKRCAEEARGELSKILFSDDCLEPNCLSEMVPRMEDPDIALVYSAVSIGETRESAKIAYAKRGSTKLSTTVFIDLMLRGLAPVSPGAILIRTSDLLINLHTNFPTSTPRPFNKHGAGPDVMVSLLTAENYPFVSHLQVPLVFFRVHSGSFTIKNKNNHVIEGYWSVLSYYLLKKYGRKKWLDYVSRIWLNKIKMNRRFCNPRSHLIEYEGSGSVNEVFALFISSIHQACKKFFMGNKKLKSEKTEIK